MPTRRRMPIAVVLLLAGWGASASLVPALRPFMLDGLHYDCFWGTNGPVWSCEDDPGPNLIVPFTELLLAVVAVLALAAVLFRARRRQRSGRDRGRAALVVLAAVPSAYAMLLVGSAVVGVDTAVEAAQHFGDFRWLAWSTLSALVVVCMAVMLAVLLPERSRIFAMAAGFALATLLAITPGLAWLVPLGLALVASFFLTAPTAQQRTAGSLLPRSTSG